MFAALKVLNRDLFILPEKFDTTVPSRSFWIDHIRLFCRVSAVGLIVSSLVVALRATMLNINPLRTKLYLSDLKTQFVPHSKHSLPRL